MSGVIETRYASGEMAEVFSDTAKYSTWRMLWADLAEAEKLAGAPISDEQVAELRAHAAIDPRDVALAADLEKETHHDVMAHILVLKKRCPRAAGIIHLGATSCYITDNTDVLRQRRGLCVLIRKLYGLTRELGKLAGNNRDVECVGYTHYQAAQPTTVGKRMAMWLQDLEMDLEELTRVRDNLKILGCKGATGTCADLLELTGGDADAVRKIDTAISDMLGVASFPISGQTYTRKQDYQVIQALAGIAQSASKFANDIRLLSHDGEIMEPFGCKQVGSSAMPYKKNPMMCERICSLSRMVICNLQNAAMNTATQWLERTLDDSADRRVTIPDTFMLTDGILELYAQVLDGLVIDRQRIFDNLCSKMEYLNTERLLMHCVGKGMDRQEVHEIIRSVTTSRPRGGIAEALYVDGRLGLPFKEIQSILSQPHQSGMAEEQVTSYLWELQRRG